MCSNDCDKGLTVVASVIVILVLPLVADSKADSLRYDIGGEISGMDCCTMAAYDAAVTTPLFFVTSFHH